MNAVKKLLKMKNSNSFFLHLVFRLFALIQYNVISIQSLLGIRGARS